MGFTSPSRHQSAKDDTHGKRHGSHGDQGTGGTPSNDKNNYDDEGGQAQAKETPVANVSRNDGKLSRRPSAAAFHCHWGTKHGSAWKSDGSLHKAFDGHAQSPTHAGVALVALRTLAPSPAQFALTEANRHVVPTTSPARAQHRLPGLVLVGLAREYHPCHAAPQVAARSASQLFGGANAAASRGRRPHPSRDGQGQQPVEPSLREQSTRQPAEQS
jgi:hypothetical protein